MATKGRAKKLTVTEQLAESNEPRDWVTAARRKTCKLHTLEKIVEKSRIRKEAAKKDDSIPGRELGHLDFFICSNPNISEEILLSKINEYGLNSSPHSRSYLLTSILRNPNVTEKILDELATSEVLMHPLCSEKKMQKCLENNKIYELLMLAQNPDLPVPIQRQLAESSERKVRQKLSMNPYLDESIIELLSEDRSPVVIRNLVKQPNVKEETKILLTQKLKRIGRGRINKVTLARHSNDAEDLKEYIQEEDYFVAYYATQNENFSAEHAELGCGHKYKGIRNVSKNHEKCPETGKIIAALMD